MTAGLENLNRILREDPLIEALRSAFPSGGAPLYICGLAVADALSGAVPAGVQLAVDDPDAAAGRVAAATGGVALPPGGGSGVRQVACRAPAARRVVLVPLEGGGIEPRLAAAGLTALAMAVDVRGAGTGALVDPYAALAALEAGRLAVVPGTSLRGRPALALLAAELCARFALEPDGAAEDALRAAASSITTLPGARAWALLGRALTGGDMARKAVDLRRFGVLEALLPEVAAVFPVPQNYYHHLPVWEHTLETLDNLERLLREPSDEFHAYGRRIRAHLARPVEGGNDRRTFLRLAALVHDVGKASTMTVKGDGRIRFQGHQREGALLAWRMAARLGLGYRGRRYLTTVVGEHMRLGFLMKQGESTESRLRAVRELGDNCPDVCVLSLADRLATRGEASSAEATERYRRLVKRLVADYFWDRDYPELASGGDILLHCGAQPGPGVGAALFDLRVAQRQSLVSSRKQALEYIGPDFKGRMS